jgi:bacterial/archaeal transporter family protein
VIRSLQPPTWLLWSLAALLAWGLWAILPSLMDGSVSAGQVQALSTIGVIPVMLVLGLSRKPPAPGNARKGALLALAGGALGSLGNVAYYDALSRGGNAATVITLTALYPLVTVLLAMFYLKERLNGVQVAGVATSLAAIYLLNMTGEEGLSTAGLAFLPVVLWGITALLQKLSTHHLSGEASTLWFLAAYVPVGLVLLAREPLSGGISIRDWLLIALVGFSIGFGNLAILAAFARGGKASIITPLTGLYPVVSVPIAVFLLDQPVGAEKAAGIALALVSVVALSWEGRPGRAGSSIQPITSPSRP